MKISVIGCGRWGAFIAWYLDSIGHSVKLYGRSSSTHMRELLEIRTNGLVSLADKVELVCDFEKLNDSDVIVVSIPSQGLRNLASELEKKGFFGKKFVLCMKGIEIETGKRLSQVAEEFLGSNIAVWLGPGHVQEFYRGVPNCMVIDSLNEELKVALVNEFSSNLIRFYYGGDLLGNEVGAAAKNVIGIAAGMLDGLDLSSLKGALMARGAYEVSLLIDAMGGKGISAYGLCHLGDYEATVFSRHSHNRKFGEAFVKKEVFDGLAEGYYTAKAMMFLAKKYNVELPITSAVYNVVYNGADPKETLNKLFERRLKKEL